MELFGGSLESSAEEWLDGLPKASNVGKVAPKRNIWIRLWICWIFSNEELCHFLRLESLVTRLKIFDNCETIS